MRLKKVIKKRATHPLYAKSCNQFKEYFQADKLETQAPSETQILSYFNYLRVERNRAFSSLWTLFSMIYDRFCWMEISAHGPRIHKSTSRNALFTLLNNDESTPGRECGLVQPMKEESAIIDSQDSTVRQNIMKVHNSFLETQPMHHMDIVRIIQSN